MRTTVGIATSSVFYRPEETDVDGKQKVKTSSGRNPKTSENLNRIWILSNGTLRRNAQERISSNEKNQQGKIEKFFKPYLSLRANGGILSMLMLEMLSFCIYLGISKYIRTIRKPIKRPIALRDDGLQEIFYPWFRIIFINVEIEHIACAIAVLLGLFCIYLLLIFVYYRIGHPKSLIINNWNKQENKEEESSKLWERLEMNHSHSDANDQVQEDDLEKNK